MSKEIEERLQDLEERIEDLQATFEIMWYHFFAPALWKIHHIHEGTAHALAESLTGSERESIQGLQVGLSLSEVQRRYMLRELELAGGNITKAARALRVDKKTIYNYLHKWGMRSNGDT